MYTQFTEYNDWEGERWNFYIPTAGNEAAIQELKDRLGKDEAYYFPEGQELTEEEVDTLVRHAHDGYMSEHTKLAGRLELPTPAKDPEDDYDTLNSVLYKGGITNLMKKPT